MKLRETAPVFEIFWPERLDLARTPTPLEPVPALGRNVWVKRDDMTGVALSGNKVRKLEFLLAEAKASGAGHVITCGGVNSNHARATAVAAARVGLKAHLVLRGEDRRPAFGNLLLSRFVGATSQFITPSEWEEVDSIMASVGQGLQNPYVIPEGGSNALGCLGYARALQEILHDAQSVGIRVARVVHAVGSGGTTAGLALGCAACGVDVDIVGVCVCEDRLAFDRRIRRILEEAEGRAFIPHGTAKRCRWRILEGFVGPGYAKTSSEAVARLRAIGAETGLLFDPVYSGKALLGLLSMPELCTSEDATVFIHTGGIFELFAYAGLIDPAPEK
ncbi:MAG: 1-aminocyclopropane-1-carboxylate deaminase/D-cysteine desulfhydrase [Myxococcota bacterium]